MAVVVFHKRYTETLAVMLNRFRTEYPQYSASKLTYAGRLDPLAEGVMVILTDEDVHKKEEYLRLQKVYEVDVVFGISTDTYDILGIPHQGRTTPIDTQELREAVAGMVGTYIQSYPPYSSRTVEGKPLYQWAREGALSEISVPEQKVTVSQAKLLETSTMSPQDLLSDVTYAVIQVEGDFRQEDILKAWNAQLTDKREEVYTVSISFSVSSGTYVRGLVHTLGEKLSVGACCTRIRRISIAGMSSKT